MISAPTVVIAILLAAMVFAVPRRAFVMPYIIAACFIPADQRIIIADLDFTVLRILVLAGVLRVLLCGESRGLAPNRFDKLLLMWVFCGALVYVLQWHDMRAIIYKCGVLFDVIGLYWLFRQNIVSWRDIEFVFKVLALCSIALFPFVAYEAATGSNPFKVLGRAITVIREGRYRCWASFPHAILLGLFWATVTPVFMGLIKAGRQRGLYIVATAASIFIVVATASSTPLVTLFAASGFFCLYRYRHYGRQITISICALLFVLHIVMEKPVWHLISRIDLVGGSTGWHRYYLIDCAIHYFRQWALLGCRSTAHWGWGLTDITNHYIYEGVNGGFISMALFVWLMVQAVRIPARYSMMRISAQHKWIAWAVCVSVMSHCMSFFGVSYFGQIMMLLYLTFAIVGAIEDVTTKPLASCAYKSNSRRAARV